MFSLQATTYLSLEQTSLRMKKHALENEFRELMTQLSGEVKASSMMGRFDSHGILEEVFRGVLQALYGWSDLVNLNASERKNFPAVDLGSDEKRVGFQITGQTTRFKIIETIETFLRHGLEARFDRLVVLVIADEVDRVLQKEIDRLCANRLNFVVDRDVLTLKNIYFTAANSSPHQLERAVVHLRSHVVIREQSGPAVLTVPQDEFFECQKLTVHGRFITATDYSVSLQVMVPSAYEIGIGAILSLARSDLKGVVIAITARELIEWTHWRRYAAKDASRPYAPAHFDNTRGFILTSSSARLTLSEAEIINFDWALSAVFTPLVDAVSNVCNFWQVHRFPRVETSSPTGAFALLSVSRGLWTEILNFAEEHDVGNGDTEWHIFDASPSSLKVYTSERSTTLDSGYHLLVNSYNESLVAGAGRGWILLSWSCPETLAESRAIGDRTRWDAETSHAWIIDRLIPKVLDLEFEQREERWKRDWWKPRTIKGAPPTRLAASSLAHSSALESMPFASLPSHDIRALESSVADLQAYFNCQWAPDSLPIQLRESVVRVTLRAIVASEFVDEYYLRSNYRLDDDESVESGLNRHLAEPRAQFWRTELDLALRGLLAILQTMRTADEGFLMFASQQLSVMWSMYQHHLLLRHWRGRSS
jgi:hypothetical protein